MFAHVREKYDQWCHLKNRGDSKHPPGLLAIYEVIDDALSEDPSLFLTPPRTPRRPSYSNPFMCFRKERVTPKRLILESPASTNVISDGATIDQPTSPSASGEIVCSESDGVEAILGSLRAPSWSDYGESYVSYIENETCSGSVVEDRRTLASEETLVACRDVDSETCSGSVVAEQLAREDNEPCGLDADVAGETLSVVRRATEISGAVQCVASIQAIMTLFDPVHNIAMRQYSDGTSRHEEWISSLCNHSIDGRT